jgi:Cu/Ag efflux pump CusA
MGGSIRAVSDKRAVTPIEGTTSAFSERVAGGRYIEVRPDRLAAARVGLNVDDINRIVAAAIGGINLTQTVEGLERYPVNIRFPREQRDSVQELRELPIVTPTGAQIPLAQVAEVVIADGAPMVGGMITAPLLSLFVIPAIYLLWRQRGLRSGEQREEGASVRDAEAVPTG